MSGLNPTDYTLAAGRTKGRGDRFAARILAGPPKDWRP